MFRAVPLCVLLTLLALGCGRSTASSFAKYDIGGGRYFVEIENTDGGSALNFKSSGEGNAVTGERYDLSWGNAHRLQIENGKLTVDGVDYGKLEPGDRITFKASGEMLVNGTKR